MTKALPRELYDPRAAREAGHDVLLEMRAGHDDDTWEAGRPWWHRAGRCAEMVEYTRRGLGLVRWYDFQGAPYVKDQPGNKTKRRITADYINQGLAREKWKEHACWHGVAYAPDPDYCPADCDVCGGHWLLPDFAFTADTIVGQVFAVHTMEHLGRVDPAGGPEALFKFLDELRPVPHPGFRAGQVWAHQDALGAWCTEMVTAVDSSGPSGRVGSWDPDGAILLHDPPMPTRAPWSP